MRFIKESRPRPNTSSQIIQAQRPRHSEIALSLATPLQFTTESRVRLPLPCRTHARSLARCPSWPRSLPFVAPFVAPHGPARFCPSWPRSSVALFSALRGPARSCPVWPRSLPVVREDVSGRRSCDRNHDDDRFLPPSLPVLFPSSVSLSACSCLHPLPVLGAAPTTRGMKRKIYPQWGYDRRRRGRESRVWDIHVG